jgi:hypothetical protein
LHVRFRPDEQYLSQNVDVPKQVRDLLENANGVLAPSVGVRLEMDRVEPWSNQLDDKLEPALAALRREDSGEGVDLVVGLVGALPKETDSLHALGFAGLLGKHMVVRSAGMLGEREAIDAAFYRLSDEERARYAKLHRAHRALAIFLHELGHCLGALHERDPGSLMNARYSPKMTGFGPGSIALMRAALGEPDQAHVAQAQLAILKGAGSNDWAQDDREQMVVSLQQIVRPVGLALGGGGTGASTAPISGGVPAVPAELQGDDRARFVRALNSLNFGDVSGAYETAKPLFKAFPNVYGVQDLRCQLATVRWLEKSELQAECSGVKRLLPAGDAGTDAR